MQRCSLDALVAASARSKPLEQSAARSRVRRRPRWEAAGRRARGSAARVRILVDGGVLPGEPDPPPRLLGCRATSTHRQRACLVHVEEGRESPTAVVLPAPLGPSSPGPSRAARRGRSRRGRPPLRTSCQSACLDGPVVLCHASATPFAPNRTRGVQPRDPNGYTVPNQRTPTQYSGRAQIRTAPGPRPDPSRKATTWRTSTAEAAKSTAASPSCWEFDLTPSTRGPKPGPASTRSSTSPSRAPTPGPGRGLDAPHRFRSRRRHDVAVTATSPARRRCSTSCSSGSTTPGRASTSATTGARPCRPWVGACGRCTHSHSWLRSSTDRPVLGPNALSA